MVAAALKRYRSLLTVTFWSLLVFGALTALFLSAQNSAQFGRWQPWILLASAVGVIALLAMLIRKTVQLIRAYRSGVPGSRLTSRTVLVFGALVALPLLSVYVFSLQFLNRGIDSWFQVEIKQSLDDAVVLSRAALDLRMREQLERTERFAQRLSTLPSSGAMLVAMDEELRRTDAAELVLYGEYERIIGASSRSVPDSLPERPSAELVRQVIAGRSYVSLEPVGDAGYVIRTSALLPGAVALPGGARFVVVTHDLPRQFAELTDAVQRSFSQYGDLAALREPLKYSFSLTLTMVLLVTLLGAIYGAIYSAEVLFKPVQDLMAGTRAVAKGDFATRVPLSSHDEMGFLVQSFNDMTKRLRRARQETESSREAADRERERLAVILARLSTGVITVDRELVLQRANAAADAILGVDLTAMIGKSLPDLVGEEGIAKPFFDDIRARFAAGREEWREQIELRGSGIGGPRFLASACVRLPQAVDEALNYVIVFDDVTRLLQVQREAAWGEVARRLAHEIKNPLTPIQLSAERLRRKVLPQLAGSDADLLERSTHTIVQQVEAMKQMVNDFSEYARAPAMKFDLFDLNQLAGEALDLYRAEEGHVDIQSRFEPGLEPILGDRARIRQVLNNLLTNAIEALEGVANARIELQTGIGERERVPVALLTVTDNGPGFQPEILGRIFDPYVSSKPRGTGLGLAIVRKIVEDHGGVIEADNQAAGGARVRVMLPFGDKSRSTAARERRTDIRRERA
jgi:nitrogen fixation/metabolism regulation signal transduction histidine kinase